MESFLYICVEILEMLSIVLILQHFIRKYLLHCLEFQKSVLDNCQLQRKTSDATFSGAKGESVYLFLEQMEDEFSAKSIEDSDKVAFCFTGLRDNARQWAECAKFKTSSITWLQFKSKLFKHYSIFNTSAEIAKLLFSMKYAPGTDFEDFVWYFRNYYLLWSPLAGDKEIVRALIPQLPSYFKLMLASEFEKLDFCEIILNVKRLGMDSSSFYSRNLGRRCNHQ